jgi:hypothetical protein
MPVNLSISALAAVLFDDITAESVAAQLRDCDLVSPPLLDFEPVNVCISKIR